MACPAVGRWRIRTLPQARRVADPPYNAAFVFRGDGMSIKSDRWIRRMAEQAGMIEPFEPGQVKTGADGNRIVSFGTSSYGYDVRCSREFKVFTNINSTIVDPKHFDPGSFVDIESDVCIIPPNSFALARTVEYFRIPRDTLVVCLGKSTYARCGIIVNVTPLEPEWEGHVTLEFSNTTPLPARIYANEGVARDPEILDGARQGEGIGRDDALVAFDVDEAAGVEMLGIDDRRVDVGEHLELARAAHVVAIARGAVADDAVAVGPALVGKFDLARLERLDHAVLFGHGPDPAV